MSPEEAAQIYTTQSAYIEKIWDYTAIRPKFMFHVPIEPGIAPVIDNIILSWDEFVSLTKFVFEP